jgi:hypothetical protein
MADEREWYEQLLDLQLRRNDETWKRFREHGIDAQQLRLGFAYLSPGEEEAQDLAAFLRAQTDYVVEVHAQGDADEPAWVVVGHTQPTSLRRELLDDWVEWMVAAGAAEGPCAFDGWTAQVVSEPK